MLGLLSLVILIAVVYTSRSTQPSIQPSAQVGQVAESTTEGQVAEIPKRTVRLKVYKGWNLVTLGVIDNGSITCSPKDLLVLYGYDPLEKRYIKIKDITEVSSNVGILGFVSKFYKENGNYLTRSPVNSGWLYSTKDCEIANKVPSLDFTLEYIRQFMQPRNMKFPAGWNFFSVAFDMVNKNLEEIKGDCAIERAYIWNPEGQDWMNMKDLKFAETILGNGLVFKTTNDCVLGEIITIPGAPTLPE